MFFLLAAEGNSHSRKPARGCFIEESCVFRVAVLMLPAVGNPEALVLSAAADLAGVETLRAAFLLLHAPDQFGFVHLPAIEAPVLGNGPDFGHVHG
jgi:hypothetical protein